MSNLFVGQMADLGLAEVAATIGSMLSRSLVAAAAVVVAARRPHTLLLPVHCSNNSNKYNIRSCKDMMLHMELVLDMEEQPRPLVLDRSAIVAARAVAAAAAVLFCRATQQNKHLAGFQHRHLQLLHEGEPARSGRRCTHSGLDADARRRIAQSTRAGLELQLEACIRIDEPVRSLSWPPHASCEAHAPTLDLTPRSGDPSDGATRA